MLTVCVFDYKLLGDILSYELCIFYSLEPVCFYSIAVVVYIAISVLKDVWPKPIQYIPISFCSHDNLVLHLLINVNLFVIEYRLMFFSYLHCIFSLKTLI